jgi:glycosidase
MVGGDENRLRFAYSLLFSLPGTPVLFYGEEIGMGDNPEVPGRLAVRTAMQWTSGHAGGFTTADRASLTRPPPDGAFGPAAINVVDQMSDPGSMLRFIQSLIATKKRTPEIGAGTWALVDGSSPPEVLILRFEWADRVLVTIHNFSSVPQSVDVDAEGRVPVVIVDSGGNAERSETQFDVEGLGYRWIELSATDDLSWKL